MTSSVLSPIDLEAAIVERLKATVQAAGLVRFVYDTKEYSEVAEESQLVPSLVVIYNGYRAVDQVGHGLVQKVELEYLVVIVTRSSKQTLRNTGAKTMASEIFHATLQALTGWKPAPGHKNLMLGEAPGATHSAGATYLPVAFTTSITYTPKP